MLEFCKLSLQVTKRHFRIYMKDWFSNVAPSIIDPLLFIVAFGIGLGAHVNQLGDKSYIHYMAPGLVITTALFTAFFETSYGFFVRMQFENIYKALLTTPVGVNEIICGEFIWVGLKGAFMSTVVSSVLLMFGLVKINYIFLVPFLGFTVAVICGAIGFMASAKVRNINQFQTIYAVLISPMFFFSGVFYPTDGLPTILKYISSISPLYHGVKISQQILWDGDVMGALLKHGSILVLLGVILIYISVRLIRPKLIQ